MKPVVTPRQMADLDAFTIQQVKIPGIVLMENAGAGIAKICLELLASVEGKKVVILCGPGNNGGDGYVVARHLANRQAQVTVYVLANRSKIGGDALTNLVAIENMNVPIRFPEKAPKIPACHLIVDAMLGTGVTGAPRGIFAEMIRKVNHSHVPVVAVDIPTGINANNGAIEGDAVAATATATMACLKPGLLFSPGRDFAGKVSVIDISMPPAVVSDNKPVAYTIEVNDVAAMLPRRRTDAYKNQCGTIATIAGSTGFTGAAALTAHAALRAGAGLSYLAVPSSINAIMEGKLTEVITWPLDDAGQGYLVSDAYPELIERVKAQDVVAIGPGLGQHRGTGKLLAKLLTSLDKPLVLDADGLNLLKDAVDLIRAYKGEMIVTPHPGELSRLLKIPAGEIIADKLAAARRAASLLKAHVVLKGGPTVIAAPGGALFINKTGNAGMATAGSGDVLTGVIAGLLAQRLSPLDAALAGVFVHGLAGDLVSKSFGQLGMVAADILNSVPAALVSVNSGENEKV